MTQLVILGGQCAELGESLAAQTPHAVHVDVTTLGNPVICTQETQQNAIYAISCVIDAHLATSIYTTVVVTWQTDNMSIFADLLNVIDTDDVDVELYWVEDPDHEPVAHLQPPGLLVHDPAGLVRRDPDLSRELSWTHITPTDSIAVGEAKPPHPPVNDRLTRSAFSPWPVLAGSTPAFPPGIFTVDRGPDLVQFWFDPSHSMDVLPFGDLGETEPSGCQYSIFEDNGVFFHGTWRGNPHDHRFAKLARLNVTTGTWEEPANLTIAGEVTTELAHLILDHRDSGAPVVAEGDIIIDTHDHGGILHTVRGGVLYRFIEVDFDIDVTTDEVIGRGYHVISHTGGDELYWQTGGYLALTASTMLYSPNLARTRWTGPLTGTNIPRHIRDLYPILWNNGHPLEPRSALRVVD